MSHNLLDFILRFLSLIINIVIGVCAIVIPFNEPKIGLVGWTMICAGVALLIFAIFAFFKNL